MVLKAFWSEKYITVKLLAKRILGTSSAGNSYISSGSPRKILLHVSRSTESLLESFFENDFSAFPQISTRRQSCIDRDLYKPASERSL